MALATCISPSLVKVSVAVAEDLSPIRMFHPSKGHCIADSRSVQMLETLGYKRCPVTPPQGPKKKG